LYGGFGMFNKLSKVISNYKFENIPTHFTYKQCIVVRSDIKMTCGKRCGQVSHASIGSFCKAPYFTKKAWLLEGQCKIVLKVSNETEFYDIAIIASKLGIPHFIVEDAGRTELEPGTVTAIGIGPAKTCDMDKITGKLSLFKE
jgi:PTH2 family peptidyl-tRNA hydrolase